MPGVTMLAESPPTKNPLRRKSGGMGRPSLAPELLLTANDDQFEKENARQNANAGSANPLTPFKSMKVDAKKRQSFDTQGGELGATPKGGRLDGERLQSLYGDCIKLANENKITQKNAWTMNLLDHIRGLTGSGSETDFVTAGCTLDAAGKIYSCRVDSVHNETFRVCTGLTRSAMPNEEEEKDAKEEGGSDEEDEEDEEAAGKKKRVKKASASSTLESNPDALIQKKLETESHVDPLFQTMCKAFDEGGARGLLLNQLTLGTGCTVMIDSSAVDDPNVPQIPSSADNKLVVTEAVDCSELQAALFRACGAASGAAFNQILADADLCPNAAEFLGLSSADAAVPAFAPDAAHLVALPADRAPLPPLAVGAGAADEAAGAADEGLGGEDEDEDEGGAFAMEDQMQAEIDGGEVRLGALPALKRKGGALAFTGQVDALESLLEVNDDYAYFSQEKLAREWAGPSHWTFRARQAGTAPAPLAGGEADGGARKGRKKESFQLDLQGEMTDTMRAGMAKSKAPTVLANPPSGAEANTLPDDHHFDPANLFALFLRPRTRLRPRVGRAAGAGGGLGLQGGEWCCDDDDDDGSGGGGDGFDTDGGAPGFDAGAGGLGAPGGVALLEQPRRAQRIEIGYAKTAKKIDIKALKENIWASVQAAPAQEADFSQTIAAVPRERFPEVSVPFCFICLLHLCNERSLSLLGSEQVREGGEGSLCAGSLADLRIIQDP